MKRGVLKVAVFLLISVFLSGCNFFHKSYSVSVSKTYIKDNINTYAILPFKDERNIAKKRLTPNAANVMSDSFETAFLASGFRVVERSKVEKVLKEMKFSHKGYVNENQLKRIGKLTNSDAIIIGLIRVFQGPEYNNRQEPDDPTKCSTISFSVKAINVETGELLWKGSITKATGISDDLLFGCEYEVYRYADKIAEKLMEEIMEEVKKADMKKNPQQIKSEKEMEE